MKSLYDTEVDISTILDLGLVAYKVCDDMTNLLRQPSIFPAREVVAVDRVVTTTYLMPNGNEDMVYRSYYIYTAPHHEDGTSVHGEDHVDFHLNLMTDQNVMGGVTKYITSSIMASRRDKLIKEIIG